MNPRAINPGGSRPVVLLAGIGLVGVVALVLALWLPDDSPGAAGETTPLSQARAALQRGDFAAAQKLASRIEPGDGRWAESRLIAGEAAARAGRYEAAIGYYTAVPRDGSNDAILAALSSGEVYRQIGRLSEAEQAYSYVLEHEPAHAAAHSRMAFLLGLTGRRWESLDHYMFLIRSRSWTLPELALLGDLERPLEEPDYVRRCVENAPRDVLVQMAQAAQAIHDGHPSDAQRFLRQVVARRPDLVAAQAMLGELLVDADDDVFAEWHAGLPPAAEGYADIWFVRGLWARRHRELKVAARCFWETLRLVPAHRRGSYQLGQVLASLGEPSSREFLDRSIRLFDLSQNLDDVLRSAGRNEPAMKRVTTMLEETGRLWEACAWAMTAGGMFPSASWPRETFARLSPLLRDETPRVVASANLALQHDFSTWPDHGELLGRITATRNTAPSPQVSSSIRFEEAAGAGLNFVYFNGPDSTTKGVRMFEQTGGGVAVLDFDADGLPDLFFPQGTDWEPGADSPTPSDRYSDRIFRNVNGSAEDVTIQAGLVSLGFGQGCAASDFNDDGFPDLYVANIGRNRLYRNNGDGTFTDITDSSGLEGADWTASCAVVDLNADALPDLFDVNYLKGDGVYRAICRGRACSPTNFSGATDRLLLNRGDGTFEPVPNAIPAGSVESGKGLGIVAADLHARGRPSLFIANDQVANVLVRSLPSKDRFNVRLQDVGLVSGLAFNGDGLPMACMGIAADDADGNGLLDFFVTNFEDESNTLYLQDSEGLFLDATGPSGLRAPSIPFVGWGTQFLDADLDGDPDLVLVNGHVDDYRDEGGKYHMRPQFFRNTGGGRFEELFAETAGDYFGREFLGRGLARLDWNRDGKMDFVVSNIGQPAALVTNVSTSVGRFLNVRLHAVASARDAIGSVVSVKIGERRWTKQLVAGDGYMASNERMLQFGLGNAASIDELRVEWPSGETTVLHDLPVDATVELTENASWGTLWRGTQPQSLPMP